MRVFVTGGTGFVGSRVVSVLLELGHEIVLLTRKPRLAAPEVSANCRVVCGDLGDPPTYVRELEYCDAVIHGARADDADPNARALRDMHCSMQLASASANAGVCRFVYVSSISAYEHPPAGLIDEASPRSESCDPYSFSKVWIERSLLAAKLPPLEVVVLQPGNIYGPGTSWWGSGQLSLMRSGKVIVPAFGEGTANLIHVDDLVRYLVAAIQTPDIGGESFLITDGGVSKWREYYEGLEIIVGRPCALYVSQEQAAELSRKLLERSVGARVRRVLSRELLGRRVAYPLTLEAISRFSSTASFRNDKACDRLATKPIVSLSDGLASLAVQTSESSAKTKLREQQSTGVSL